MEDAKNIKTAMFTDYPKGKQITAIMQAVGILISVYLLFYPETTFLRLEHIQNSTLNLIWWLNPQQTMGFKRSIKCMQNNVFLGDHPVYVSQVQKVFSVVLKPDITQISEKPVYIWQA